ncbi:MAG: PIN domain-containing protein [Bryobacteraceae bacterium]
MRRVFADAIYWIAMLREDQWTKAALKADAELADAELVTTEEVLTEVLSFCAKLRFIRNRAAETIRQVVDDPAVRVIGQSHEGFLDGLELYAKRPDKGYSHTDCVSMIEMKRLRIREILSADRHFEQEGFTTMLRSSGRLPQQ